MRFGIATTDITPPFPTAMHGYGVRHDCFDGINDPLTFTAVVLEEQGQRAVLGAADLCTFANDGSTPELLARLAATVGCPAANIMLCASHTHGGPKMPSSAPVFENQRFLEPTRRYSARLSEQVAATVEAAVADLADGTVWFGEGRTRLPMNRRPDRDGEVPNAPNPGGPVDDRMQLLVFRHGTGALRAVGMRLSCHPVATGAQHLLTADYPGAWRTSFAAAFGPGVTPFFLQGAGADARPRHVAEGDHWRQMPHAELSVIGTELLHESLAILTGGSLRELGPLVLDGHVEQVNVPCEHRYTTAADFAELQRHESSYVRAYAEEGLQLAEAGRTFPDQAPNTVQTLWLDSRFALIGLDGEPLCGLGAVVEQAAAPGQGMLLGYVNGCGSYLPDTAELQRGGYEADSFIFEHWTGPWKPGLEHALAAGVVKRGTGAGPA